MRFATLVGILAMLAGSRVLHAQMPTQGIKVHGHWVIEVRNTDGTVQVRREFDNALLQSGKTTLINLFTGTAPMGRWEVSVSGSAGPCIVGNATPSTCFILEPSSPVIQQGNFFRNLTKTANSQTSEFVLKGSFIASNDGSVINVFTAVENSGFFTQATLAPPIAVQATQTVSVTVTFTFS